MNDDFLFGVATSAYQIEGGWNADGKVPSIWDEISHGNSRFRILNGHTGDVACDHYHKWREDVKIMTELGIDAYRFSISWSRVIKEDGSINKKGIDFYKNLVDELLKHSITPFVTLYHWCLPRWLDDQGGWGNPNTVDSYLRYAESMFAKLDKVKHWITFNEPAVFVRNYWGHNNFPEAVRNVLIAHGKTVRRYKEKYNGKIGISLNLLPVFPARKGIEDETAAENINKMHNWIWLDPIFRGRFPEKTDHFPTDINELFGLEQGTLSFSNDESEVVKTPMDFLGINYYTAATVEIDYDNSPTYAKPVNKGYEKDDMNTERRPLGIYHILEKIKKRYGDIDTYITENGCAYSDAVTHDGQIHDERRIEYIRQHLKVCNLAVEQGFNLKGYFYWSLMDNFEWLLGYTKRFGLLYVDYPTYTRIPKDSYDWYQMIITMPKVRNEELGVRKDEK